MDFEKTLEAATDSIILNPKLDLFRSLAQMMTSRPSAYFSRKIDQKSA